MEHVIRCVLCRGEGLSSRVVCPVCRGSGRVVCDHVVEPHSDEGGPFLSCLLCGTDWNDSNAV